MSQVKDLVEQLKRKLQSRGLTYNDVAESLDVSESTVKRWFTSYSFDIERLDDFAKLLNIDISELFKTKRKQTLSSHFTEIQELELAHNEGMLSVLYLVLSGITYGEVLAQFDITPAKLRSYLSRLDHLGLIELHAGERVVPLVRPNMRWLPDGPLNQKYGELIRMDFMNTNFTKPSERYWFVHGRASDATLQVFGRKFDGLLSELQELMDLDQDLSDKEATVISLFSGYRPWRLPIKQLQRKSNK